MQAHNPTKTLLILRNSFSREESKYIMDTNGLRRLWKEAFGDSDAFLDAFFSTAFHPERFMAIWEQERPVAALYWFDCQLEGRKIAYIYAVATAESHRGQGLCHRLMEKPHILLKRLGYSGSILVPAEKGLFSLYKKLGYALCAHVDTFSCQAGTPISLTQITGSEYTRLRRELLPAGGLLQEDAAIAYLQKWCGFYQGEGCLVCAAREGDTLYVQELLGNRALAPGITAALAAKTGHFRMPGTAVPFAMYYPLDNAPAPTYLGLALD